VRRARCCAPVLDAEKRASICGKPATGERVVEGVALTFCALHLAPAVPPVVPPSPGKEGGGP
jgi:hypothetical protein